MMRLYIDLMVTRQAFDMAQETLKTKPTDLTPLVDAIQMVTLGVRAPKREGRRFGAPYGSRPEL